MKTIQVSWGLYVNVVRSVLAWLTYVIRSLLAWQDDLLNIFRRWSYKGFMLDKGYFRVAKLYTLCMTCEGISSLRCFVSVLYEQWSISNRVGHSYIELKVIIT